MRIPRVQSADHRRWSMKRSLVFACLRLSALILCSVTAVADELSTDSAAAQAGVEAPAWNANPIPVGAAEEPQRFVPGDDTQPLVPSNPGDLQPANQPRPLQSVMVRPKKADAAAIPEVPSEVTPV